MAKQLYHILGTCGTLLFQTTQDQASLDVFVSDSTRIEQFLKLAKKYRDFDELTTPMINEFIEKSLCIR